MILDEILKRSISLSNGLSLEDIFVGIPYTFVIVEGENRRSLGIAPTPMRYLVDRPRIRPPRPVKDIKGAISLLTSDDMLERAIGLAAVNAVSQHHIDLDREDNLLDPFYALHDHLRPGVQLVVVSGEDLPLPRMRGCDVRKFRDGAKSENDLPLSLLPEHLHTADIVIMDGYSLMSGVAEVVRSYARSAEIVMIMGPTAQVHPDLLHGTGITHVSSMKTIDIEDAVEKLKRGMWTSYLSGCKTYTFEIVER